MRQEYMTETTARSWLVEQAIETAKSIRKEPYAAATLGL